MTAALLVTAALAATLKWTALVPYTPATADEATLRLSWRMRGVADEKCWDRAPEELEKLPVHMRTARICERVSLAYSLTVQVDDGPIERHRLSSGGAHGDRPIYMLADVPMKPGTRRIRLRLTGDGDRDADDVDAAMDRVVVVGGGEIALVTLHNARFALLSAGPPP